MRTHSLLALALVCVSTMLAPAGPYAQRAENPVPGRGGARNAPVPVPRSSAAPPVHFIGITAQKHAMGTGALILSRVCDSEFPGTRLCEWGDVFRTIPPPALETAVLVAPNFDVNPTTGCLTIEGYVRCRPGSVFPVACCGFGLPPGSIAGIALTPDAIDIRDCADHFVLLGTVLGPSGEPVPGIVVTFSFANPGLGGAIGFFSPTSIVSDATGTFATELSLSPGSCLTGCTGGHDCSTTVVATDASGQIVSNAVQLIDQIP